MNSDIYWQIILLIILLSLSAFFSSAETALMSLNRIKVLNMIEEKVKKAELLYKLIDNPNKLLSAILVGNNIVNIGASALATSIAITYLGDSGVTIATIIMTFAVLVFAEITPKSLAVQNSEKISLKIAKVISFIVMIFNPIIIIINYITDNLIRLLGGKKSKEQLLITENELKTMIDVSHEEGVLEIKERQMIHNVFQFADTQVKNIMIPRTATCFINANLSYEEIINRFKEKKYSRMPVYRDSIDNIIGVLHVKNLLFINSPSFNVKDYLRKPFFTYEFKRTIELFEEMRYNKERMSIILDEYGGTAGIVTLEDLVEEIVGEIEDEFDTHNDSIIKLSDGEYIVDGRTDIEIINEILQVKLESENFDSIGGYLIGEIGYLPNVDETYEFDNIFFTVVETSKNIIKKLKLHVKD